MQKKKRAAVLLICGVLALAGCAEPETENTFESSQVEAALDADNLQEEQGRLVNCTFEIPGEEGFEIEIQAVVTVPETVIETGEFEQTLPSVEMIEECLTNGEKMIKSTSDDIEDKWEIEADADSGTAYKMSYFIEADAHISHFSNASVKNMADFPYTDETCPNTIMAEKMQSLTVQAENIYEKMGMQVKLWDRDIGVENDRYMAKIKEISLLDGIPLVWRNGNFITSSCFIADDGVSSMTFAGSFTKKNTKGVSVISIDDLLGVISAKVEGGEIVFVEKEITSITLAYCMDFGSQTFYPVWCLCGDFLDVCINAQTGEVV